jgi:hypothetical protein
MSRRESMMHFLKYSSAKRRGRSPAGLSLIEVTTAVAVSSLLMGTVVSLAIALKRADRNVRLANIHSARLIELAEMLRLDIRQGTGITLSENKALVISSAGGGESRYELGPQGCERSLGVPGDKKMGRDLFAIGPADSWSIDERAPGRHPLYIVTLNRPKLDEDAKPRQMPLVIYAALGADLPAEATVASAE